MMKTLNLEGLQCPMPILKTKQALNGMAQGDRIKVIATDPHSEVDFKVFLDKTSNLLIDFWVDDMCFYFIIEKNIE